MLYWYKSTDTDTKLYIQELARIADKFRQSAAPSLPRCAWVWEGGWVGVVGVGVRAFLELGAAVSLSCVAPVAVAASVFELRQYLSCVAAVAAGVP